MKIIADDKIPFLKGILEPFAEVIYLPGGKITRKEISGADALLIRTRTKCTGELLGGSQVKFIGTATIGFDHIDTRWCSRNSISWTNAPGCNSSSVQQYIAAALLKMASEYRVSLRGRTIGIIGVGNVGSKVAKLAEILGMEILLNDPPRARKEGNLNFSDLKTVLAESDILTLHVPLNVVGRDATWHLIGEKTIKRLKKGCWIINTSRGEVADTSALKKFVESAKTGGAIIDVWENEPDIDRELMTGTFIATPHIAGYSTDGKANGTSMIVNAFCRHFGFPLADWYPDNVPEPEKPVIQIDAAGKSDEEIIGMAVGHSYNIDEDNINLRFSPSDFEKQRGDYRLRREFPAYSVRLDNGTRKVAEMLLALGFEVL